VLLRPQRTHQRHQVVERVALDVELGLRIFLQQGGERVHVAAADVALVRARMDGDAGGAGVERDPRQADDARDRERALVAQQRDLVHVDRKRGRAAARVLARRHERVHRSSACASIMTCRVRSCEVPR
jgi:hypothetical protein